MCIRDRYMGGSLDIACKTILQCYFMDEEMFVGEQRFVEDFIREFMEFFSKNNTRKAGGQLPGLERKPTLQLRIDLNQDDEDEKKNAILDAKLSESEEEKEDSEESEEDIETITDKKSVATSAVQVKAKQQPNVILKKEDSDEEEVEEINIEKPKPKPKGKQVSEEDEEEEDEDEDEDDDDDDDEDDEEESEEESEESEEEEEKSPTYTRAGTVSPVLTRSPSPALHRTFSPTLSVVSRRKEDFKIGQTIKLQKMEESANLSQSINSMGSSMSPVRKNYMLVRDASYQSIESPVRKQSNGSGIGLGNTPLFNRSRLNIENSSISIEDPKDPSKGNNRYRL
eukprot:TRINITY_DN3495_c0_g5_i1.p1 TRINITY_DN3495_c0_g5~~TRINITY_DN3495_c0_g5_i1.p1  ORF type:complete len:340 (-),score=111.71 TRINITY_DN3495_c0_g5_i1:83-1102(-)